VQWRPAPAPGAVSIAAIPHWLAAKHKQLACESRHEPRKDANMDDRIEDAGNGVLFRNEKR